MFSAKKLLHAIDGELLHHVYLRVAAVITTSRVALTVFVSEHAARSVHDRRGSEVLRSDQLQTCRLTFFLLGNKFFDFGIGSRGPNVVELRHR